MTAYAKSHHRSLRKHLRIGTALAGGLIGLVVTAPGLASTLPTGGAITSVSGTPTIVYNNAGGAAASTLLTVTASSNSIVTWQTYNVPVTQTVTYTGCMGCTILNRVTGGTASTIDGNILATNINIWLVNTAGITFSSTGVFNGGGLVLSTLPDNIASVGQLSAGTAVEFASTPAVGALSLNGTITSSGSVLLVGQQVAAGGMISASANPPGAATATSNPVVIIAASDVAFPSGAGSPLSYLIKGGTPVTANQLTVAGSVNGTSVAVGAMSQSAAYAAILQISATGGLTATANGGSVTIATTNNGTATGDTVVADGGLATNKFDEISFGGGTAAQANVTNGSVSVFGPGLLLGNTTLVSSGTGAVTLGSTLDGAHTLTVTGNGVFDGAIGGATALSALTVTGTSQISTSGITTTGAQNYDQDVTLGVATTLDSSAGNGAISLGAVTGNNHGLTITPGTGPVVLNGVAGTSALALTPGNLTLNAGTYNVDGGTAYSFGPATTNGTLVLGQATTFGALTLASATKLDSSAGNAAINLGTVDGGFALTVATGTATATFGGTVGASAALASLTVAGPAALNGGALTTTGLQDYQGAATLGANTGLHTTNSAVTFDTGVDGGHGLTVNAGTGTIAFGDQAGGVTALGSVGLTGGAITLAGVDAAALTITNSGLLTLDAGNYTIAAPTPYVFGAATTNGTLTLGQATTFGALTLGSTTKLNSGAVNGAIMLGAVNGAFGLTVNSGTAIATFGGMVGGSTPLASLIVNGPAAINGDVSTSGLQDYQGAVTFGATTDLTSTGGTVTFGSTANGGHGLTVTGNAEFDGVVGGTTALSSLDVTGTSLLKGGAITTVGTQQYAGTVTLGATANLATTNSDVTFGATVDGAHGLTVNAGTGAIAFDSQAGGTAALGAVSLTGGDIALAGVDSTSLVLTNSGTLFLNTGNYTIGAAPYTFGAATTDGTLTLGQATSFGALTLGGDTTVNGGNATFAGTIDGPHALVVGQNAVFGGVVGGTMAPASLSVTGTSRIQTTAITTSGAQQYQGAVTLAADSSLRTTNSNVTFGATVDGAYGLIVNAGTGAIAFDSQAGGTTALGAVNLTGGNIALAGMDSTGLSLANSGTLFLNTGNYTIGAAPYTFGAATTDGTLTLGQATSFGAVKLVGDTTVHGGNATFTGTVDGGYALAVGQNAAFGGVVGGSTALASLTVAGTSQIQTTAITTSGAQDYEGAVTLAAGTILAGSTLKFEQTLDGGYGLTARGNAVFGGQVGGVTPLAMLTVTGVSQINTTGIATTGAQDYQGAVTLGSSTTLGTVNSNVTFGATVDGGHGLTVNAGTGAIAFDSQAGGTIALGAVSLTGGNIALAGMDSSSLLLANSGTLFLNTGNYTIGATPYTFGAATTNGTLTLGQATTFGPLLLGSATTLDSSAGNYAQTLGGVSGAQSLIVAAGTGAITLNGGVGSIATPLTSLSLTGGTLSLNGGTVYTTGLQSYTGPVTLGTGTMLDSSAGGGNVSFSATIAGGQTLAVNAGTGTVTLGGAVGTGLIPLTSVSLTGGALALGGGAITTTGAQGYTGPVTLGTGTTFDSSAGGGNVSFASTIVGPYSLAVNAGTGAVTLGGAVGASLIPLTSVSLTGGSLALDGGAITTSGLQTFTGSVTLGTATMLDSSASGGNVSFTSTIVGPYSLAVNAGAGTVTLGGSVGTTGSPLTSLSLTGGSLALDGGAVTTTGLQRFTGPVTLGTGTILDSSAGGGNVSFASTIAGPYSLAVNAGTGTVTLGGAVGTGLIPLTSVSLTGGALALGGGAITTTGAQGYTGPVTLATGTTFDSSAGGGNVSFASTIAGPYSLAVNAGTGAVTLGGAVGTSLIPLTSVSLTGGSLALDGGAITTSGLQTFAGAATLGAGTTLTGSTVTFGSSLDGAYGLNIAANAVFDGPLGGMTPLASLTVAGISQINTTGITTSGAQDYRQAVLLGSGSTLTGSTVTFAQTVDGAYGLTVGGNAVFDGAVGATTPLTALTVTGTSQIDTGAITTSGTQDYQQAVTLLTGSTLTGSTVTFAQTLDGNYGLTVGGNAVFGGVVGGNAPLLSLTVAGTTLIDTGAITTSGAQDYKQAVTLGTGSTLTGSTVTFEQTLNGAFGLNVMGNAVFGGQVGQNAALTALTVTGTSQIDAGAITTTGAQDYKGAVTLGTGSTLSGSNVTFATTLDGAYGLTVGGNAVFDGPVGTATPLGSLTVTGTSLIDTGAITTTGLQDYQQAVTLATGSTLTGSSLTFAQTLDGGYGLTVAGNAVFGGPVGGIAPLAQLTVTGISQINATGITTSGAQDYQNAVTLGSGSTLSTVNSNVTFGSTVDGAYALAITPGTGLTSFDGVVGQTVPLASLAVAGPSLIDAGAITTTGAQNFQGAVTLASDSELTGSTATFGSTIDGAQRLTVDASAVFDGVVGGNAALVSLDVKGTSLIDTGVINSAGQGYTGAVTLATGSVLTGSSVAFGASLDGAYPLQIAGNATFGGVVGGIAPLAQLTVTGTSQINTTGITTTGAQDYQSAVTLGSGSTLSTTNANVTLGATLDGAYGLTVNAGTGVTLFDGVVGSTAPLASLTVAGPSQINTGSIITTGAQDYQQAVTLLTNSTQTGSTMTYAQTLDGDYTLTVAGNAVFGGVVGGVAPLATLAVNGSSQINTSAVSTAGAQSYGGAVTLGADSTLTSATGNVGFGSTLDGAKALTVNAASGAVTFGNLVGSITPLSALTATATQATITAAIKAGNITLVDSGPAGSTMWLGDAVPGMTIGTGFVLSGAAIGNLQATGSLVIDASQFNKPNIVTGNFALAAPVADFDLYGPNIAVWGNILGTSAKLATMQIGENTTAANFATSQLMVIATAGGGISANGTANNAGGAIDAGTAALTLGAASIAAGQTTGFLSQLPAQAQAMINNPGSSLYYAVPGGGAVYSAPGLIVAGTLTVRYTNFALFQNTGVPGINSGVVLGSAATPLSPALIIYGGGTANNDPFAIFGTINGVGGVSTALLGSSTINAQNISPPISRINGCVIGSSAGCLTPAPLSTVLQVVDAEHVTIFYANADYIVAFDPLVGTNNEALFDDFSSLGIGDVRDPTQGCLPGARTTGCPAQDKGAHR